jgi:SulP family sulfate permease
MRSHLISKLFPLANWSDIANKVAIRPDFEAGVIGAILILPQAIALAALAGMPPEYGIYTSIIPVMIAALWGSSWHTVSGPNTAICVLIVLSVSPLAAVGSSEYIGYVLSLSLMAGLIQLAIGMFGGGAILDYISQTVISAIIFAVGLIILVSSATGLLGINADTEGAFFWKVTSLLTHLSEFNGNAAMIGGISVITGLVARFFLRRYALVMAILAGTTVYLIVSKLSPENASTINRLGSMPISLLPFSFPELGETHWPALQTLLPSAASVAFLGLMQTVVISRAIAAKTGQQIDVNQEAVGQGLANVAAPFLSCFAGSGSFNRSAANYDAGAKTPVAALVASVALAIMVFFGSDLLAWLPSPAIAAVLILVGLSMIDIREYLHILRSRHETVVFLITMVCALTFGLNTGVLAGVLAALVIYIWLASKPNISFEEGTARDGHPMTTVTIDGGLFFGSVNYVQRQLVDHTHHNMHDAILLLNTEHMTYLDVPGAAMIANEALHWKKAGGNCYVFINRKNISRALDMAGFSDIVGPDALIYQNLPHPMKDILYPLRITQDHDARRANTGLQQMLRACDINALVKRLRLTRLLGGLSEKQLATLVQGSKIHFAAAGDILAKETGQINEHHILIAGKLEAQRTWTTPEGTEKSYTWVLEPANNDGAFAFLGAATHQVRVRALTDVRYIKIDADKVDACLGWVQHVATEIGNDPILHARMELVMNVSAFSQLPLENVTTALKRFSTHNVQAGETIVSQGDEGGAYYVMEDGQAKVIRTDPFTDETETIATLGEGDAFGEEALLQCGFRNATVEMITPGKLLVLQKTDFDELIEPQMAAEIEAEQAQSQLRGGKAMLIDCRYDMEYEESRIPGAIHIPLDRMRWDVHKLNANDDYIVYCRSGRRSLAAAFLLRERNINATSLIDGIKGWPYEVDASPLETS